jgi:hypothetical protein
VGYGDGGRNASPSCDGGCHRPGTVRHAGIIDRRLHGYRFHNGRKSRFESWEGGLEVLMNVKVGRPVTLFLRDGRQLEGRFSGWSRESGAFSSAADSLQLRGESVKLATRSGEVTTRALEIARVSVSVSRGKVTGLLIGAAVDALVIAVAAYGMNGMVASSLGD